MADITVNGITKSFVQDRVVLSDISFQINEGEKVAILGGNGAGKTTLLRIIMGEVVPDAGFVNIPKSKRVGYVAQLNAFSSDKTVNEVLESAYDEIIELANEISDIQNSMTNENAKRYDSLMARFEALGGYEWKSELARIANGLGIGEDMRAQRYSELSGGEQTRVALARLIMKNSDILLLDEPTNHLDIESLEWLEEYLKSFKGTFVVVSHDRYFLDNTVERIIEIDRGKADFYSGNYTYYAQEKEIRYQRQLMMYEREQAKVKQLEFQIARLKAWGSVYDNPALHKRAAAMERRIERTAVTDKPVKDAKIDMGFSSAAFRADIALEMENISKSYGEKKLFENITCGIYGHSSRIAILGGNGTGKTTLLKILTGEIEPDAGNYKFGASVTVAYLPQVVVFEHPERTLYDTMLYETGCEPQEARDRLGAYRFTGEDQFKKVSELSGGERARLRLCIIMRNRVNLLILDEPTNHLDLASREWIEEAVESFEGTLLFVSHDRYFIRRFARRVWEIDKGVFTDYDCDYDRYRSIKTRNAITAKAVEKTKKPETEYVKTEKKERNNDRMRRKQAVLERDIDKLEKEIKDIELQMGLVESDYVKWGELDALKEEKNAKLEEMYLQWAEFE